MTLTLYLSRFPHLCLSLSVCALSAPNPQIPWYVGGIWTIFPGHCCLCLTRCVCKFPHREADKHTHTVTCIYKPCHMAARTLYDGVITLANCPSGHLRFSTDTFGRLCVRWKLLSNPQLHVCTNREQDS